MKTWVYVERVTLRRYHEVKAETREEADEKFYEGDTWIEEDEQIDAELIDVVESVEKEER